ncbi:MAG: polyprenyl synthetase family protein [Tannerella sp.]|jgi:geranylgeranyl diphosphate synthase type II|nr:polyprenyl synthetase family protein [Tannerella sp.]
MLSFEQILQVIDGAIGQLVFASRAQRLFDPIKYTLANGGKRIRPAFVLMTCDLYGESVDKVLPTALGLEIFHNFTLLHDDLMDEADIRRNRPTVHKKWNRNTAILSGDAMLISAYRLIGETPQPYLREILSLFTQTAIEICEGQQFDMEFEAREAVTEAEYIEMIRLKTAVLLACCLKSGAIVGGAPNVEAEKLYRFGLHLGLAFQLQDDLLDVYGNPQTFGKNIGGDILCNKKTFLLIHALKQASAEQKDVINRYCRSVSGDFTPAEKIAAITSLYDRLQIKELTENRIAYYYDKAMTDLDSLGVPAERLTVIRDVSRRLMKRES